MSCKYQSSDSGNLSAILEMIERWRISSGRELVPTAHLGSPPTGCLPELPRNHKVTE